VSLRFFSDQCVPLEIGEYLRTHGHEVILLRDHLPIRSQDHLVIQKAQELNAILLSLNGDFASTVSYPPSNYGGIVSIQLHNHPEVIPSVMSRLNQFLKEHPEQEFYRGKLFIVEAHRVRIRES
jgi:predicted nuclease of predicted toxin-antitoxin system